MICKGHHDTDGCTVTDRSKSIHDFIWNSVDETKKEGYTVRRKKAFKYNQFSQNMGKYVRDKHVQTDQH